MNDTCVVVFTSRSTEVMAAEGGSQAWVLDVRRARTCRYLVCTWNPRGEYATAGAKHDHGEGFLVAPISSIESATPPHDPKRSIIRFTEYADVHIPRLWNQQRNPVFYTTLNDLGIDLENMDFIELSGDGARLDAAPQSSAPRRSAGSVPLTIAEAKKGLAIQYGVLPESVEIVIRG